jgi:hypothetical protein
VSNLALSIGVLLIIIGVTAYLFATAASLTALIPAFLGVLFVITGVLGRSRPAWRRHAMHAAAAVALLGLLGSLGGVTQLFTLLGGGTVARPVAVVAQSLTALLCLVFLVLAVRSFIQARRGREPAA